MPLRQWYSSAKQPPGQRTFGTLQRLQRGDDVVADAAGVGDGGVGADPDALVDAVAEMLGELAEEVAVDLRARFRRVDGDGDLIRGTRRDRRGGGDKEAGGQQAGGSDEAAE